MTQGRYTSSPNHALSTAVVLIIPWPLPQMRYRSVSQKWSALLSVSGFSNNLRFKGIGALPIVQPPFDVDYKGLLFVRPLPLDQSGKVEPIRDYSPSRHSSWGHWDTQASPPRQGGSPRWSFQEQVTLDVFHRLNRSYIQQLLNSHTLKHSELLLCNNQHHENVLGCSINLKTHIQGFLLQTKMLRGDNLNYQIVAKEGF